MGRTRFFSELGDALAKVLVLEQELEKARKAIQRSKKAAEVQALVQENDALQRKLRSQEEEFHLQNQTLLTELSHVSGQCDSLSSFVLKRSDH